MAPQAAYKSFPGGSVYCVAKAGVVMLTRVLAHELGRSNIRINAIAPSVITTEFMAPIMKLDWTNEQVREATAKGIPLGRPSDGGRNRLGGAVPGLGPVKLHDRCHRLRRRRRYCLRNTVLL